MASLDDAIARRRLFANLLDIETPPVKVGRFRLSSRLGAGGMGTVWAAYDEQLERPVALKFLLDRQAQAPEQLLEEARNLAQISHPNVITIYDVGVHNGRVWLAMEKVAGKTLRESMGSAADTGPKARLRWWLEAGQGLAAVHAAGLVHRDIKPDNVLLGDDGRVRLIDFGIVCTTKSNDTTGEITHQSNTTQQTPRIAGTLAYAAPEQLRGSTTLGPAADQFAFCVSVWEAICGTRPDPYEPNLKKRPRAMSGRVYRALVRGMSPAPRDRFADMSALLQALSPRRTQLPAIAFVACASLLTLSSVYGADDPCRTVDTQVRQQWGERQAAAMRDKLSSDSAGVVAALDDWTAQWSETALASCRASRVDGTRSPKVHDQRMACLERRLDALVTLTEVVDQRPALDVSTLGPWLAALRPPKACLETNVGEAATRPPHKAKTLERRSLGQRLAHAEHGLFDQVSLAERIAVASAIEMRGQQLHDPSLQGEAARVQGRLLLRQGRAQASTEAFGRALDLATEARDRELEADTWSGLAATARDLELDFERASWSLARRQNVVSALKSNPEQHARLLAERGVLRGLEGELDTAIGLLRSADEAYTQLGPLTSWDHAAALRDLGNLYSQRGQRQLGLQTVARAQQLEAHLQPRADNFSPPLSRQSSSLLKRGLMELDAGELDTAQKTLQQALKLAVSEQGPRGSNVLRAHLGLAAVADTQGKLHKARTHSEHAQMLARATLGPLNPERADVLSAVGAIAYREGRFETAVETFERALNILDHHPTHNKLDRALAQTNLAEALAAAGHYRRAKFHADATFLVYRQALGPNHPDLAFVYKTLGAVALGLEQPQEAIEPLARALALFTVAGHQSELAHTRWLRAQAEWAVGHHRVARIYANHALAHFITPGVSPSPTASEIQAWLIAHPGQPQQHPGEPMSSHSITVTDLQDGIQTTVAELTASPGDTLDLINHASQAVTLKFCQVDANDRVLECPAAYEALAPGKAHTGFVFPQTSSGEAINALHVVAGDTWPRISVKRPPSTGG